MLSYMKLRSSQELFRS